MKRWIASLLRKASQTLDSSTLGAAIPNAKRSLDDDIQSFVDRDALHRWIDTIPDGTKMLFLAYEEDGTLRHNAFGYPKLYDLLWIVERFRNWLLEV